MDNNNQQYRVADIYADKGVFITGASGFLGKVLVEKLLYSTNVKCIYLLIRPLKGHPAKERLEKMLHSPIYDRIRQTDVQLFQKLIPVSGDLMHENLGLSQDEINEICENVSIVFHCAATVKFDEILRVSVQMNLVGTQRLLAICHKIKNLISVVHASTAYANCNLKKTQEKVYDPPVHPQQIVKAIEWMPDEMLETVTPQLLGKRPNTYTFTKALAETQVIEDAKDLPVIIIRPSIIGGMWREPLPGWTDNFNGPSAIFAAVGKGVLTNMCGSGNSKADIIPVDICSNALIVAAAHRAVKKYTEIPVIHCTSGSLNTVKWGHLLNLLHKFYALYPLDQCSRPPATYFHTSKKMFMLNFYYKHYLPAHVLDLAYKACGKKPSFVRIYGKVWKLVDSLHYFTTRGWDFEAKNIIDLWNSIDPEDQKIFNFDIRQVNWNDYLFDIIMGVKVYLLKEDIENLPEARNKLARMKQVNMYWNAGIWAILIRLFAWKRTRTQKWSMWFLGFMATYIFQNYDFRPAVHMKSLEEYKRTTGLVKSF
jgi:fatty acyl-CoA reductase